MAKTKTTTAKEKAEGRDNSKAKDRLSALGMPSTLTIQIGNQTLLALAKEFSTGSVGYYGYGKIIVGEENHSCQVSLNVVAVNTKSK